MSTREIYLLFRYSFDCRHNHQAKAHCTHPSTCHPPHVRCSTALHLKAPITAEELQVGVYSLDTRSDEQTSIVHIRACPWIWCTCLLRHILTPNIDIIEMLKLVNKAFFYFLISRPLRALRTQPCINMGLF